MGDLSKSSGIEIDKVVQSGQGLVYIVYPYAATTIEGGPVWAVMFFIMMIALGMGTMMASVETLCTSLEDFFPVLKKTALIKAGTLGIICTLYFVVGLIFCSHAGTYWIELFDEYSANYGIIFICLIECISVGWFYGTKTITFLHLFNLSYLIRVFYFKELRTSRSICIQLLMKTVISC